MKGIMNIALASFLALAATSSMADTKTSMDANWVCTTNASSSSVEADKAADDKMANTKGSASDSFAFAATHCRDCTKITCEMDNNH